MVWVAPNSFLVFKSTLSLGRCGLEFAKSLHGPTDSQVQNQFQSPLKVGYLCMHLTFGSWHIGSGTLLASLAGECYIPCASDSLPPWTILWIQWVYESFWVLIRTCNCPFPQIHPKYLPNLLILMSKLVDFEICNRCHRNREALYF